jgi:hypothetical protein
MTLSFRRLLEECRTVEQAIELMKSIPRTTCLSISLCDRQNAAVLELTPQQVVTRHPAENVLVCTNHFRTPQLQVALHCPRYDALAAMDTRPPLDVDRLWQQLHRGSVSRTLQAMIFEPAPLRLYLSYGVPRATTRSPRRVDLEALLSPAREPATETVQ